MVGVYFSERKALAYGIAMSGIHIFSLSLSFISVAVNSPNHLIHLLKCHHLQVLELEPSFWLLQSKCLLSITPGEELCSCWEDLFPTCVSAVL